PFGIPVLDGDGLALHVAHLAQPLAERLIPRGVRGRNAGRENPNEGNFPRRLRVGGDRPREEPDDKGDEQFHSITSLARMSSCWGSVSPGVLAVLGLMPSSYFVGWAPASWTGLFLFRL